MNKDKIETEKSEWVRTTAASRGIVDKHAFKDMVYENLNRRYTRDAVYWIVNEVFNCFDEILREGKTLKIRDSFTMKPKLRNGRHYNARGKYEGQSEDRYIPYFKPHQKLREACLSLPVNNEKDSEEEE